MRNQFILLSLCVAGMPPLSAKAQDPAQVGGATDAAGAASVDASESAAGGDPLLESAADGGLEADIEVDPLAFGLGGYSLHVGLGAGRVRIDLGAFAARLPALMHGNRGFDVDFDGFGAKLDVFLADDWVGPFAGIEAGLVTTRVVAPDDAFVRDRRLQMGVRAGWRIPIAHDFYVTPWIGLGYLVGAGDQRVGDHVFETSPWVIFPTIHIGYRLR